VNLWWVGQLEKRRGKKIIYISRSSGICAHSEGRVPVNELEDKSNAFTFAIPAQVEGNVPSSWLSERNLWKNGG